MSTPNAQPRSTENDHLGPVVTRDGILAEAQRLHDLRYGVAHCDRKYVQVCAQFRTLLFEAGQILRTPPVTPCAHCRGIGQVYDGPRIVWKPCPMCKPLSSDNPAPPGQGATA